LIIPLAQPTPESTVIALTGQFSAHAPHCIPILHVRFLLSHGKHLLRTDLDATSATDAGRLIQFQGNHVF
jgi:hypothetical protein